MTFLFCGLVFAKTIIPIAEAISVNGVVVYHQADSFFWEEVKPGTTFANFDEIKTTSGSYCELRFKEGHSLRLDPNSHLVIKAVYLGSANDLWQNLKVSFGKIWIKIVRGTNEKEQLFIETPYISIAKKEALFSVSAPYGDVSAYEGSIDVKRGDRIVSVNMGQEINIDKSGRMNDTALPLSEKTLKNFQKFSEQTTIENKGKLGTLLTKLEIMTKESRHVVSIRSSKDIISIPAPEKKTFWGRLRNLFR